jgi:hypothetical protein
LRPLLLSLWLAATLTGPAAATSLRYCDPAPNLNAVQQDRLLRFAAVIKRELESQPQRAALIARSGLDLERFAQRYSHAGVSLRDNPNTPWSVRQLYFACEEQMPRLFDQGIAGFVQGTHDPDLGYVSLLLLNLDDASRLEATALDSASALQLLGERYSANAHAFATHYQNCNQWLAELLAAAWGSGSRTRTEAQRWLLREGYEPFAFDISSPLLRLAGAFVPWLHRDDHPEADLAQHVYRVSMPSSIEAFVMRIRPGTVRLEFCHDGRQVVVRRDGPPIADGCVAASGDTVLPL